MKTKKIQLSRTLRFDSETQLKQLQAIADKKKQSGNSAMLTLIEKEHKRLFKC